MVFSTVSINSMDSEGSRKSFSEGHIDCPCGTCHESGGGRGGGEMVGNDHGGMGLRGCLRSSLH